MTGLPFARLAAKLENVPPEPRWGWAGYLAPGAVTLLAGRPKVGKSTLLFGLFDALTRGGAGTFAGRKTRELGVLLLTEERADTLAEKQRRFELNGSIHGLMRHEARGKSWAELVAEAVAYCKEHGLGALVVDTLDKWAGLRGDAENNAGSVLEALEPLLQAAGAGLAVVVVVHQRKSFGDFGEAVRGSNALTGGVDIVLELERPRAGALDGAGVRVLKAVSRFGSTPEELVIALTDDGYEAHGSTFEAKLDAEREQVLAAIEELGGARREKLCEKTELKDSTMRRHLDRLGADGLIHTRGTGVRGDPFIYVIGANPYWQESISEPAE